MSKRRSSADADPVTEAEIRRQMRGERRRPGARKGVYGVGYLGASYYLNPDQFGYTTSQAWGGSGGGEMTTTGGAEGGGGGDGGGASA